MIACEHYRNVGIYMVNTNADWANTKIVGRLKLEISQVGLSYSPGVLDDNPGQIRNKLKILSYVLETT